MPLEEKNNDSNSELSSIKNDRPKTPLIKTKKSTTTSKKPSSSKENNQTKLTDFLKAKSTPSKKPAESPTKANPANSITSTSTNSKDSIKESKSPKLKLTSHTTPATINKSTSTNLKSVNNPAEAAVTSQVFTSPVTRSQTASAKSEKLTGNSPAKKVCLEPKQTNDQSTCCNLDQELEKNEDEAIIKSLNLTIEQMTLKDTDPEKFWEQNAEALREELAENLEDNKQLEEFKNEMTTESKDLVKQQEQLMKLADEAGEICRELMVLDLNDADEVDDSGIID